MLHYMYMEVDESILVHGLHEIRGSEVTYFIIYHRVPFMVLTPVHVDGPMLSKGVGTRHIPRRPIIRDYVVTYLVDALYMVPSQG